MDPSSLKVDATFLLDDSKNSGVYICNINIPVRYFEDESVRQRVHAFIEAEFNGVQPTFQICGSYYLKHKRTDEEKFWAGSFTPKGNLAPGRIPELFTPYTRTNLQDKLVRLTDISTTWAYFGSADTEWVYHRPNSAIININAQVPVQFNSLLVRGLTSLHRKHVCFELPQ
jgi:hypothetical protein